jgi:signal transduction histidine kinase
MNKVSSKLILLLILTALVPLTVFGGMAVWTARNTARQIVAEENLQIAKRAAHEIEQHVTNSIMILEAMAQNLAKTDLKPWQKERMIRNYTLAFEQFQTIDLTDRQGRLTATSRLGKSVMDESRREALQKALSGEIYRSEVFISPNFTPGMIVAVPLKMLGDVQGAIAADLNLIEMWRLVDGIRIGKEGYAMVVSRNGRLIAHGRGSAKENVLRLERISHPTVQAALNGDAIAEVYRDDHGIEKIGVSAPVPDLGWGLVIEQPTREAYAAARQLTTQLTFLIGFFLLLMLLVGMVGGQRYVVAPIRELIRGIRGVAGGNLANKVKILTHDEFRELGEAFNSMTERLSELKENIRRNERAVFLGQIASGLVHDLRHPVKNLENTSFLVIRYFNDPKIQNVFKNVVEREFANLNRFLDNLLHLTRPTPLQPISLDLSKFMHELLESLRTDTNCVIQDSYASETEPSVDPSKGSKVRISVQIQPPDLKIHADRFGLERVLRNLIMNAIEAMPKGGRLTIEAGIVSSRESPEAEAEIRISDTGIGIPSPQLKNLFSDYTTTKRKGIGLGLAICKKIVEEHKATIKVQSRPGLGTMFTLRFPCSR